MSSKAVALVCTLCFAGCVHNEVVQLRDPPSQRPADAVGEYQHERAIYAPDPPLKELARKGPEVLVRFRVNRTGRTRDIQALSGEPASQRSAERTVAKWRFKPALSDAGAHEVEREVRFDVRHVSKH